MRKTLTSILAIAAVLALSNAALAQQGSGQRPMGKEGTQEETTPNQAQPPSTAPGAPPSTAPGAPPSTRDPSEPPNRSGQMPGPKGQGSGNDTNTGR